MSKALATRLQVGTSHFSSPAENVQHDTLPPRVCGLVAGAGHFAEEDFELGEEFLSAFSRASERVAGFVVGCTLIGAAWLAFTFL